LLASSAFGDDLPGNYVVPDELVKYLAVGDAMVSRSGTLLTASIHNPDQEWTITEVIVLVVPRGNSPGETVVSMRDYNVKINVPPLSTKVFSVSIEPFGNKSFSWTISRAFGNKFLQIRRPAAAH